VRAIHSLQVVPFAKMDNVPRSRTAKALFMQSLIWLTTVLQLSSDGEENLTMSV
jgi:hypothetical protein